MLLSNKVCPICESEFISQLQDIYLQRQEESVPQYFCMDCKSSFHHSGFKEAGDSFVDDTQWLVEHPGDYSNAIAQLKTLFPKAKTCFEAGCGAGSLLSQLKSSVLDARGVDPNPVAVKHARDNYNVNAEQGYFKRLAVPVDKFSQLTF